MPTVIIIVASVLVYLFGAGAMWKAMFLAGLNSHDGAAEFFGSLFWPITLVCWLGAVFAR